MISSWRTRSRRFFAVLVLLMLVSGGLLSAPAHAQLGITAGLNFAQMDDFTSAVQEEERVNAAFRNATGYHVGLAYEMGSGQWTVRPAVVFRTIGTYALPQAPTAGDVRDEFDLRVIEVPFDIRVQLFDFRGIGPYLFGGPMASFPRSEGDFSEATERIALAASVGGGLNIAPSWLPFVLQPELRYDTGVTDFFQDDFTVAGQTFDPQDEPRNSAFSVRLNLLF